MVPAIPTDHTQRPRLSVLDLCPILSGETASQSVQHSLELARFVETRGYHRYWLAEHHNMEGIASSSPEVVISHVAQVTRTMRVGSGGIMLPNHAPLRIAEAFRSLEAFHPGRIDLGLGRAPGSDGRTAIALRGSNANLRADDFPDKLNELVAFLTDKLPLGSPYRDVVAVPTGVGMPELWILGSSDFGARLAAEKGLPYAFAQHFSPLDAREVMGLYQRYFVPSRWLKKPRSILAVHVICADTDDEARDLALASDLSFYLFRTTGKSIPLPTVEAAKSHPFIQTATQQVRAMMPKFVGSPLTLRKHLLPFFMETKADEMMVLTMIHDQAARRRSYALLADLFNEFYAARAMEAPVR